MFPHYTERHMEGEIAIWLLITVGALLIPTIVVAICCIRHHLSTRPRIKLMGNRRLRRNMINTKQVEALRSYNGPYMESANDDDDDVGVSSDNKITSTFSCTNSVKKPHVHWLDRSTTSKADDFRSINVQLFSGEDIFNTTKLTESPSAHRHSMVRPTSSSSVSYFIPTSIIPVGSAVINTGTSQFLTPSKEYTSISIEHNIIV